MKNTSIKIVFSFTVILILLIGLSKLYDFALGKNCNIKASYIQSQKIDADILIHGPCEPLWMIYPPLLDKITGVKSYNLALVHSDFADNYLHLYLYLKNNKVPKHMFLYATPEGMDHNKYNTFHTYRFSPYVGDPIVDSVIKENDSAYFKWTKIPFMKYAYYNNNINFNVLQGLKHYINNKTNPRFADGYEPPLQRVWDYHLEEVIKENPKGYTFGWGALQEKYLRKTITLAQNNGIHVILYESPIYKAAIPYQLNRKEMIEKIRNVAADYDVEYIQFENMEMSKHRKYYTSALNTSIEGARIFTDSLGRYIKNEVLNKTIESH